jgi:hypothetical protein
MIVHEEQATEELVDFIRHDADLDDLARLYTLICTDETVAVQGYHGSSDYHKDGKPVRKKRKQQ